MKMYVRRNLFYFSPLLVFLSNSLSLALLLFLSPKATRGFVYYFVCVEIIFILSVAFGNGNKKKETKKRT